MDFRALAKAFAALALVSGMVGAVLWKELADARAVTASLRAARDGAPPAPGRGTAPGRTDGGLPAAIQDARQEPSATATPAVVTPAPRVRRTLSEAELRKDPEYRQARVLVLRSSLARSYPGLAEELGLTPEEADRFFGLLAEHNLDRSAQLIARQAGDDPATVAQRQRESRQAQQEREDAAIQEVLGETRYQQWRDYQGTRSARMQANDFANTLAQAGLPLAGEQDRIVATAVMEERRRSQERLAELSRNLGSADPGSQAQRLEALDAFQRGGNQRMLEAVSAHLSPQQQEVIRIRFEQEAAMRSASDRLSERTRRLARPQ